MPLFCIQSTLAVLVLLVAAPAFALDPNAPGDLSVAVVISPDDKFIEEWFTTPAEHGPTLRRIKEARANQMVHVGFVITGYTTDQKGVATLHVDVRILYPDGSELMKREKFATYNGKPSPSGFVLAGPVLQLLIESTDPKGQYTIHAVALDKSNGKNSSGHAVLNITP